MRLLSTLNKQQQPPGPPGHHGEKDAEFGGGNHCHWVGQAANGIVRERPE